MFMALIVHPAMPPQ